MEEPVEVYRKLEAWLGPIGALVAVLVFASLIGFVIAMVFTSGQ
jgi:hypothetical protein